MSGPTPGKKEDPRAWDALTPPLAQWILDFVHSSGFARMTPVQAAVLANFLGKNHKDVVVEAVTGSGKTLSFLIPVVQRLLESNARPRHHIGAIIISPTRELAGQIHSVLLSLLAFHAPSAEILPYLKEEERRPDSSEPAVVPQLLIGGTTTTSEDLAFFMRHSPNIVISTPGRLVELLSSRHVHCSQSTFEVLVLDEADRLLDLGFKTDLQSILGQLPKQRRTGLFSASVGEAVGELIRVGLRNPIRIAVRVKNLKDGGIIEDRKTPASLKMCYLMTRASQKLPAVAQLLSNLAKQPQKTIIFLSTCAAVDYFQHVLPELLPPGFALVPLHGKHQPKVREKNFVRFVGSVSPTVLLTTDLASRGLDIPQVDLVIQIDAPSDPKVFIHRCGRAGRAGRKGLAVVMLHPQLEEDYIRFLEVRQTPIAPLEDPEISVSEEEAVEATDKIRKLVLGDRALHEKAQKAFPSWVRSYTSHQAASIFRVRELDWADLGNAWGLLKMPKMPEVKAWEGDRKLGQSIDWDEYRYKDKIREKQRKAQLEAEANGEGKPEESDAQRSANAKKRKNNEAWSGKGEREEQKVERREKRLKKQDAVRQSKMTEDEKVQQVELDDLLAEVRRRNQKKPANDSFEGFDD
jgi:ATP-dependent RNA helicase DDX55/SPB4